MLPPPLLSEQVLTDGQVNAQRLTVTFPRVEPKHRPWAAPNGVPNASSLGCSEGDERQPFITADEEADLLQEIVRAKNTALHLYFVISRDLT